MSDPTEMETRVAGAIVKALHLNASIGPGEFAVARAAIRAMREPTTLMMDAGRKPHSEVYDKARRTIWRAMIDAASPVGSGGDNRT